MSYFEVPIIHQKIATLEIPGSKSYTNRALILAALTKQKVILRKPLYSEDTLAMIRCLKNLGLRIDSCPDHIVVHDDISTVSLATYEFYAHDSGTTARFILPLLCLIPGTHFLKGSKRLSERPIKDLVDALRHLGAKMTYLERENQLPLKIETQSPLSPQGVIAIDASLSSQFLSALLMISPLFKGIKIQVMGKLISRPYIDMTVALMKDWGVIVKEEQGCYFVDEQQKYQKNEYLIEGDFSSACYFFAIAALTQSTISLKNLNAHSLQADRKFLDILTKMGNEVSYAEGEITMRGRQILPLTIDMEDCPDQVQTLSVLVAFAHGQTNIQGVRSLRFKETERVVAVKKELAKMGIATKDEFDSLTIDGGKPRAALIDTYGDHRMAMAFAVAGTKLEGMKINHPEVVNKTFPEFWDKMKEL